MIRKYNISNPLSILFVLIITIVLFESCNSNNKQNENLNFSESGVTLANRAIITCQLLNDAYRNQEYDNEMIRILNDHSPSTYIIQINDNRLTIIEQNIKRQSAYNLLRKAYSSYNLFLDENFDFKSSDLQNTLFAACSGLDSFIVSEFYAQRVQNFKKQIVGGHFKENMAIIEISKLYAELWDNDVQKWKIQLEKDLKNYKTGVNAIRNESFDVVKIKTFIHKPYSDEAILVNLYKLQLVKNKELQVKKLMEEMNKVSMGFGMISELYGELAKKKPNVWRINELDDKLEAMVSNTSN